MNETATDERVTEFHIVCKSSLFELKIYKKCEGNHFREYRVIARNTIS